MHTITIDLPDNRTLAMFCGFIVLPALMIGGLALLLLLRRRQKPMVPMAVRAVDVQALDQDAVLRYLVALHGGELAILIQEVLDRRPETKFEDDGHVQTRAMLCSVSRERDDETGKVLGKPQVSVIGLADPNKYAPEWQRGGDPFRQHGECARCGIMVRSHVKLAICPVCGASVPLS